MSKIACPYCGRPAELVTGAEIYPHRQDLAVSFFWRCAACAAWVGCHPGTKQPLGRLADAELRRAKSSAHAAFDPLWKAKIRRDKCRKHEARSAAYQWLAAALGIDAAQCHIGMFDVAMCHRVIDACRPYAKQKEGER